MKSLIVQMSCHIKELTNGRSELVYCIEVTIVSLDIDFTLYITTVCKSNCMKVCVLHSDCVLFQE